MNLTAEQLQIASMIDGKMQKLVCDGNDDLKVELALWTFMNQIKPTFLTIVIAVIYLSTNVAGYSQGTHSKFEAALKKELLSNHQRHVPVVTVKGSEVRLTYGPELEWTKSSAHDDVARMDALTASMPTTQP
jgi:hypothetical protein